MVIIKRKHDPMNKRAIKLGEWEGGGGGGGGGGTKEKQEKEEERKGSEEEETLEEITYPTCQYLSQEGVPVSTHVESGSWLLWPPCLLDWRKTLSEQPAQ